jgi:hypothetical protein
LNAGPLGGEVASPTSSTITLSDAVTSSATINQVTLLNKTQDGTAEALTCKALL